jgi:hypothetical protein
MLATTTHPFDWNLARTKARPARPAKPARESLFARLLAALHHSRRLQAEREIKRYSHLIANANAKTQAFPHQEPPKQGTRS